MWFFGLQVMVCLQKPILLPLQILWVFLLLSEIENVLFTHWLLRVWPMNGSYQQSQSIAWLITWIQILWDIFKMGHKESHQTKIKQAFVSLCSSKWQNWNRERRWGERLIRCTMSPQENQYAHCSLQLTYQPMPATSCTTGTFASPAFERNVPPDCLVEACSTT